MERGLKQGKGERNRARKEPPGCKEERMEEGMDGEKEESSGDMKRLIKSM